MNLKSSSFPKIDHQRKSKLIFQQFLLMPLVCLKVIGKEFFFDLDG